MQYIYSRLTRVASKDHILMLQVWNIICVHVVYVARVSLCPTQKNIVRENLKPVTLTVQKTSSEWGYTAEPHFLGVM